MGLGRISSYMELYKSLFCGQCIELSPEELGFFQEINASVFIILEMFSFYKDTNILYVLNNIT